MFAHEALCRGSIPSPWGCQGGEIREYLKVLSTAPGCDRVNLWDSLSHQEVAPDENIPILFAARLSRRGLGFDQMLSWYRVSLPPQDHSPCFYTLFAAPSG